MYEEKELYHHGIKGQKWGVRNGPPYPIGSGKDPKAFLARKRNQTIGGIQDEWNSLGLPAKVSIIATVAGALVSVASGIQAMYHSYKNEKYKDEERKIEKEREQRLREREDRLQRQSSKNGNIGAVKKKMEDMTNEELRKEIERLRLETEYERLSKDTESEGERFLKDTGKQVTQQVLKTAVNILMNRYKDEALDQLESTVEKHQKEQRERMPGDDDEYIAKPSRSERKEIAKQQLERAEEVKRGDEPEFFSPEGQMDALQRQITAQNRGIRQAEERFSTATTPEEAQQWYDQKMALKEARSEALAKLEKAKRDRKNK